MDAKISIPITPIPSLGQKPVLKILEKPKPLELVVDYREQYLQQVITFFEVEVKVKPALSVLSETLDLGDFLFRQGDRQLILIERKTIPDLLSSIVDGRYKEQKTRLQALKSTNPNLRICYLIEGSFLNQPVSKFFTELDRKKVMGAYIGMIVRDQIPVICTKDLKGTLASLEKIRSLIHEYPEAFAELDRDGEVKPESEYLIPIKIKKSENRDARWTYLAQLQQIPGVSDQVAIRIAELYPTLQALFSAYGQKDRKDHKSLLSEVILPDRKVTKLGKARTIGAVLSENIWVSLGSPTYVAIDP